MIPPPFSRWSCSRPSTVHAFPADRFLLRSEPCLAEMALAVTICSVSAMNGSQDFALVGSAVRATHNQCSLIGLLARISAGTLKARRARSLRARVHNERADLTFMAACDCGHTIVGRYVFRWFSRGENVAQCESIMFFPDNPTHAPQFSDCPRASETKRRTWRFGDRSKGEPTVVTFVVKLCADCAKVWDGVEIEGNGAG